MTLTDPTRMIELASDILQALDVPAEDAHLVADSLIQADCWGHQSHGLMRLPWYADRLRSGAMAATTRTERLVDAGCVAVIDGHDGIGQVVASRATDEVVTRAMAHGLAAVAVRNSGHFGTAAYFTRRVAERGCIGLLTTNSSPAMAPWGGREKAIGSNAWSIAVPAGRHGVTIMDISNSVVARGKIFLASQEGAEVPVGWAISADGAPTTDPLTALAGTILPMGEHKGYAISFMMDVLSGVLTGSAFGTGVTGPYVADRRSGTGHLFLAVNIEPFLPLPAFEARVEQLIEEVKGVPLAEGFDEILYPWEPEERSARQVAADGLRLPAKTWADLKGLAEDVGLGDHPILRDDETPS